MTFKQTPLNLPHSDLLVDNTDNGRFYNTPDGKAYPSFTTVLGTALDDGSLAAWRERVGEEEADRISRNAAWRGSRVHEAVEMYLQNIKPTINNPLIQAGFITIKEALDKHITEVYAVEKPLYSHHLQMAGRIDALVKWDGVRTLFDAKTSRKEKKKEWIESYFLQTTAGAIAWEELTGQPVPQIAVVIAADGLNHAQIFVEKRDNYAKRLLEVREIYREIKGV